jgi:hypothetical protein
VALVPRPVAIVLDPALDERVERRALAQRPKRSELLVVEAQDDAHVSAPDRRRASA